MKKAVFLYSFLLAGAALSAQNISIHLCTSFWLNEAPVKANSITMALNAPALAPITVTSEETSCATITAMAPDAFPTGTTISATAVKEGDDPNGVTLLDLIAISRHILGIQALPAPYALIAADANRSGSITTYDIVEIRKILLGILPEFPNNTSWRFIQENCVFTNPSNPFNGSSCPPYPIDNPLDMNGDTLHLLAVKIGDVDGDANPASSFTGPPVFGLTALEIANMQLVAGVPTTVEVRLGGTFALSGVQAAFSYDPTVLQFNGAENTANFPSDEYYVSPGKIAAATITLEEQMQPGTVLMKLNFTANANVSLWDVFSLNTDILQSMGTMGIANPMALQLGVTEGASSGVASPAQTNRLAAPRPNPFTDHTVFPLHLQQQETVQLEIFDVNGQRLYLSEKEFPAGSHLLTVPEEVLAAGKVGYYHLQAGNSRLNGKLVRL